MACSCSCCFSVRGCPSLRLAKTEGTRKLQAETRPTAAPRPPPSGHGWWRLAPKLPLQAGKKKLIRTTGGHARTRVSWATHQRAVASPIRDGTEQGQVRPPDGNGLAWLARSRRHELWRRLLASLGHRSEAASRGRESWSAWACAPVWGQDPLVTGPAAACRTRR